MHKKKRASSSDPVASQGIPTDSGRDGEAIEGDWTPRDDNAVREIVRMRGVTYENAKQSHIYMISTIGSIRYRKGVKFEIDSKEKGLTGIDSADSLTDASWGLGYHFDKSDCRILEQSGALKR